MTVNLYQLTATDKDITLYWQTDFFVQNLPTGYVAVNQNDLPPNNGPSLISGSPNNFIAGRLRSFQATIPNLTAGQNPLNPLATYYCMAVCDGQQSNVMYTVTLPSNANTVHLHQPDADPKVVIVNGGASNLSVMVRSQGNPVPNVPVLFTAPANSGQVGPVGAAPQGLTCQVNSDATGLAQCLFTSGIATGDFTIQVTASGYTANGQSVVISVQ